MMKTEDHINSHRSYGAFLKIQFEGSKELHFFI